MRVITTSNSSAMLFKLNSSLMRGKNLLEDVGISWKSKSDSLTLRRGDTDLLTTTLSTQASHCGHTGNHVTVTPPSLKSDFKFIIADDFKFEPQGRRNKDLKETLWLRGIHFFLPIPE